MALKFNPAPGWPVPYDFEPPSGWEPDPSWPPAPEGWPLWIGGDVARTPLQTEQGGNYTERYLAQRIGGRTIAAPQGSYVPACSSAPPGARGNKRRSVRAWVIILSLLAVLGALAWIGKDIGNAHRSARTGHINKKGRLDVFSLRVGDCFQIPSLSRVRGGFANVRAVPCRTAHNAQVFAVFGAADPGNYPGRGALIRQAHHGCTKRLAVIDKSKLSRTLRLIFLYPEKLAWLEGERGIRCILRDTSRDLTTSLLKADASR